ncbi:MAG: MFS transporter [Chloroflexia bacterium]
MQVLRHPAILVLAFFQVCAGLLEVGTALFGAFMLSLKAGPEAMGLVLGLGWGAAALGALFGGQTADRLGARTTLLGGVVLTAFGLAIEGLSPTWPVAAAGFVLIQGTQMASHPAVLRLVEEAAAGRTGNAVGFLDTVYTLVAVGGALLAGWLAEAVGWPAVFFLKAGLYLLALLPMLFFLPRGRPAPSSEAPSERRRGWPALLRNASLRYICASVVVVTVLGYAPSFLAYDPRLGGSPQVLSRFPAIYNVAWLLSSWPAGFLGDRLGRWRIVIGGYALMGLAWLLFPWPQEATLLYPLYALYCLGNSAGFYATLLAMESVSQEEQGRAVGLFDTAMLAGAALGEGCGGLFWGALGGGPSYLLAALGMGLGCLLLLRGRSARPTPSAPPAPSPPGSPSADGRR